MYVCVCVCVRAARQEDFEARAHCGAPTVHKKKNAAFFFVIVVGACT